MNRSKFSVVIDNYNYARFLRQSIESCLQQTRLPHEIIVVDDGSTDHSRKILQDYADHPLVRVIFQENTGQEAALQRGFDEATGDWVLGLDSDDFYFPDCLEQLAEHVADDVSWIYFRARVINADGKFLGTLPKSVQPLLQGDLAEQWLSRQTKFTFPPQSFHCYCRSFIKSITLYPNPHVKMKDGRNPDAHMWIQAAFHGRAVGIEKELGVYRDHDDGESKREITLHRIRTNLDAMDLRTALAREGLRKHSYPQPEFHPVSLSERYWIYRLLSLVADPVGHPHSGDRKGGLFLRATSLIWANKDTKLNFRLFKVLKLFLILIFPSAVFSIINSRPRRDLKLFFRWLKKSRC